MVVIIKKGSSKKDIAAALKKLQKRAGFNAKKYLGTIQLKEDPMFIQSKLRDEWE